MISDKTAHVLGILEKHPGKSDNLLCPAHEATVEDIEMRKQTLIVQAMRDLAPAMTPAEIGKFAADLGTAMLGCAKEQDA